MRYDITLPNLPVGYAAAGLPRGSQGPLAVTVAGIATDNDGDILIRYLDGITDAYISRIPKEGKIAPGVVRTLLVLVRPDKTATVHINEPNLIATVMSKKHRIEKGAPVFDDDIADVLKLTPEGLEIPSNFGFVAILSMGWRRGVLFDYGPIQPKDAKPRAFDPNVALALLSSRLMFQDRTRITEKAWINLFTAKWFPFIGLSQKCVRNMIEHAKNDWDVDLLLDDIEGEVRVRVPQILDQLKAKGFDGHRTVFEKTLEHFSSRDYLSATGLLYPRIEGLIRVRQSVLNPSGGFKAPELARVAVADPTGIRHAESLLCPERFTEYLTSVYFASFTPTDIKDVGRHTVAHGVAPEKMMADRKPAIIGVLVLEQIAYFLSDAQ